MTKKSLNIEEEINKKLRTAGYVPNKKILSAVAIAELTQKPLLIEGAPGVGKTSLAKAYAQANDYNFIRVQLYDGLTDDKILYDYDYQKQLLTLEALRPQIEKDYGKLKAKDAIHKVVGELNFYGPEFLIKRPVLRSITSEKRSVLLLDEIDKAPEEIEYMLYEFLENFSITIPQNGTVSAEEGKEPIVFITSNNYRDISDPFKRRCAYLYIEEKTKEEVIDILKNRVELSDKMADNLGECFMIINAQELHKAPSIAELVDFAGYINQSSEKKKEFVLNSLSLLTKDHRDETIISSIVEKYGNALWQE